MRVAMIFVTLLAALPAQAGVIYSYIGNPFAVIADDPLVAGTFDTTMRVTGSFELAAPLAANLPLTDIGADVIAFSWSNGRETLRHTDTDLVFIFRMETNAAGQITLWDVVVDQDRMGRVGGHQTFIQTTNSGQLTLTGIEDLGQIAICDPRQLRFCATLADQGSNNTPGVWQVSTAGPPPDVPEPAMAGLMLLGVSLTFLQADRARRTRRARPV